MTSSTNIEIYPVGNRNTRSNSNDDRAVSILSYNILHKDWITEDRYPFVPVEYRSWKYRLPILRHTILSYHADIICLQEVDIRNKSFYADFGDYFAHSGYDYVTPHHTFPQQIKPKYPSNLDWGNAILFNKTKYKCMYHEAFNNSTRQFISLFIDLHSISNCKYCCYSMHSPSDSTHNTICIHHAFFVINLHLTGHPQKHIQRLNEVKKVIQRLNQIGGIFRSKEQEIKTIGFHSNIHQQKPLMRIIICGDFNSPKSALVDTLLVNKEMDYDQIRINNISKQGQDICSDKRRIRFIFPAKDVRCLIGRGGCFIKELRDRLKGFEARVHIPKVNTNIRSRMVIVVGTVYAHVLKAIRLILNKLTLRSLVMCIEEANVECLDTDCIYANSWADMRISSRTLYNSTEKTIDIYGEKEDIHATLELIIKQLFESTSYIITRMEYEPQAVNNESNMFRHCYAFRDSYHDGLVSHLNGKKDIDAYYDRLQYFPTYGDGRIVAAMDFIYFTSNNIRLKGISHTVNDEEMMNRVRVEVEREKHESNGGCREHQDQQMEQGIVTKIWRLPNDKIVSDHLPVHAVFVMMDTCDKETRTKCDCCDPPKIDQVDTQSDLSWTFEEINSF
eukprot:727097_1